MENVATETKKTASSKKEIAANNAIVSAENQLPAEVMSGNWGAIESMETTDLLVPKIFHQQGLSKFVDEGLAQAGDFCDSLTGEKLATKDKPLEIVIFGSFKTLIVSKLSENLKGEVKTEYVETLQVTPENAKTIAELPFIEERQDGKYKNALFYNFYCLIPGHMDELPYVLSLGSTKTAAARKINTMIFKLSQLKKNGASIVFNLKSVQEENDKGKWYNLEVSQGRNTTPEELLKAYAWYMKSKTQKFKVVEEEAESASSVESDEDTSF